MEQFEYNGIWWLPSKPDNEISGILHYHPTDGITLDLIGSFREFGNALSTHQEEDIILGVTSNGKEVTLYKCIEFHSSYSSGFHSSSYRVIVIFTGHHFEKIADIVFNEFLINYYHLKDWVGINGFSLKSESDSKGYLIKETVTYVFPEEVRAKIAPLDVSLTFQFSSEGYRKTEINLKQITCFKVVSSTPVQVDFFREKTNNLLQGFLSLAIGKGTRPIAIKGYTQAAKYQLGNGEGQYIDIEFFYVYSDLPHLRKKEELHPFEMIFTLKDIISDFESCLNNWFNKEDILRPVYNLYFVTLNEPSLLLDYKFLNFIQAIEIYHRRVIGGQYASGERFDVLYKNLLSAIPQGIDKNFKESIAQKLKYVHEFSLRKRLSDIFDKCGSIISRVIENRGAFIEDVVNTRNYLTHYDKKVEMKAVQGEKLYRITQKLQVIVEICLLSELGLSLEKIDELIKRCRSYRFLIGPQ